MKVSILAHPEGRALHQLPDYKKRPHMFQSSPIPKDGRYRWPLQLRELYKLFQSSPIPKDGRYDLLRGHRIK